MYIYIYIYIYTFLSLTLSFTLSLFPGVPMNRGGLVFKAHRLVYHPTLGLRVIKKKKKKKNLVEFRLLFNEGAVGEQRQELSLFPGVPTNQI